MVQYKGNVLVINNKKIKLEYAIKQILVLDQTIIVLLDNEEMTNNIFAYNEQGDVIWRINDILKIDDVGNFTEIEKVSNIILGAYYIWGIYYEIDVNKKTILKKDYIR